MGVQMKLVHWGVTILAIGAIMMGATSAAVAGPLEDGRDAFNRRDFPTALALLRPLADQGNADAAVVVGYIEAILFRMEQQGIGRKDLEPMIGTRARVAEVLNRKRGLSIEMIWQLHTKLGISAEVLIRPSRRSSTV